MAALSPWKTRLSSGVSRRVVWVIAAAIIIPFAIWLLPVWLNNPVVIDHESQLKIEDWLVAKNATRTAMVALLVALVGVGTLLYTVDSYRLARVGQVTDRYSKAVDQLGSEKTEVQVGGIYALEKIVRDSPNDEAAVVDVLVAFLRQRRSRGSGSTEPVTALPDVNAALKVLGGLSPDAEVRALNLRSLDLSGATLTRANLAGCHLEDSLLDGCSLIGASLRGAHLNSVSMRNSMLSTADLLYADLEGAVLDGADFFGTKIIPAQLSMAQKGQVKNWDLADLHTAIGGKLRRLPK
jgi:Pentapeptide repeats (8 copies)